MSTLVVFVPFDLFGSGGAGAGAKLLADAFEELREDNRREVLPTRARAYEHHLRVEEVPFDTMKDYEAWPRRARRLAKQALGRGEFLLWVGGNHMSVLPVLEELGARRGSLVIQFDAHLDVYNLADCATTPSHGNFLLHADGPLPPIVHVGHRDLFLTPKHAGKHFRETISAEDLALAPDAGLHTLGVLSAAAERVWIDIDCDVLDPAYFPAVDGPMPFGLGPSTLLKLIDAIWGGRVAGVSITEFVPACDRSDQSLSLLVWLIEWLLLKRYEGGDEEE